MNIRISLTCSWNTCTGLSLDQEIAPLFLSLPPRQNIIFHSYKLAYLAPLEEASHFYLSISTFVSIQSVAFQASCYFIRDIFVNIASYGLFLGIEEIEDVTVEAKHENPNHVMHQGRHLKVTQTCLKILFVWWEWVFVERGKRVISSNSHLYSHCLSRMFHRWWY